MEAPLVDITPEEPSETNSMLDDYLKGFNEGIGKLVDKEQHPIKENEAEPKETFDMRNENLLLVIDENTDNVKHEAVIRNEMNLKTKEKTSGENIKRSMQEYGDNMESFLKENKNELKEDMKTFIANMDELNKEMDKLLENDDKLQGNIVNQFENKRNRKGAEDSNEQKDSTRREIYLQEKIGNLESNDQRNIFDTSRDFNVIRNFTNHNMTDRFPPDAFSSNLTVLEQTYTLEEYHRRFQKKCKRELKALEAIDIKDLDSHGVNECHAELHDDFNSVPYEYQNFMGMTVTSGIVTIAKDNSNLIGISIGGGAPLCPCLYIVQVFDNTPAAKEGTLQSGDEVVGVSGACVKGKTKVEVAKMIQSVESEVSIKYNKLHADPQQGKSLDIILKKVKHRLVENMSTTTADALGLSRAILCNDTLVKKMEELESTEQMYKGLVDHCKKVLKGFLSLLRTYKDFGDAFAGIGVREPQPRASEAFRQFGEYHRQMEKNGIATIKAVKPILSDLGTYLNKAIPDTKLTIRKYADTKFEYLSYCLKVKEMDDEEYSYAALQEPLYRVETGNYEYRLILRCRQDARLRFAALRSDVLVKLELLDNKHVQDVVCQLQRLIAGLASYHSTNIGLLRDNSLFPIEMDLSQNSFQYECNQVPSYENHGEEEEDRDSRDEELILGEEAKPGDEEEDGQVGGANCHRSEYSDLLRELDESNDSTNLLDLL